MDQGSFKAEFSCALPPCAIRGQHAGSGGIEFQLLRVSRSSISNDGHRREQFLILVVSARMVCQPFQHRGVA